MVKRTPLERLMSKVEVVGDCWEWRGGMGNSGYGVIWGLRGKQTGAHQLSYELHHGAIPVGKQVLHSCDNKVCVNPDHLFAGTQLENMHDMIAKGRQARGGKLNHKPQNGILNHNAKVNLDQVLTTKEMARVGFRQCEIAAETEVSTKNVWAILNGKSWVGVGFDTAAPEIMAAFIDGKF